MRIALVVLAVLSSKLSLGAEITLPFDTGAEFTGKITRDTGSPSRLGEAVSLKMLTMGGKAVVLVTQRVGKTNAFIDTFQITNDERVFKEAKRLLDQKSRELGGAERDYPNRDQMIAAHILTDEDGDVKRQRPGVAVILHPVDNETVQGEFVVTDPYGQIVENLWFDVKTKRQAPEVLPEVLPAPPAANPPK